MPAEAATIVGASGLLKYLQSQETQVVTTVSKKMLGYALGRTVLADALARTRLHGIRTNRDLLTGLVRTEVDRAVGRMGFVREEELAAVRKHVQRLARRVSGGDGFAV